MAKAKKVSEKPKKTKKIDLEDLDSIDIEDAAAFEQVCAEVEVQLARSYDGTDTNPIYALARFGASKKHGAAARELVISALERVTKKSKGLMNDVALYALAFATMDMPRHASIGPALQRAFQVAGELAGVDVHYNMNQAAGPVALALATAEHTAALPDIEKFREKFDHYDGTMFHTMVLYAQWILDKDGSAACAYLAESDQLKTLGWAAAALADMDHKPGRAVIGARLRGKLHAESREALLEASERLIKQKKPPKPENRMIHMFGRISPVEIALGSEGESEFRQRAIAKAEAKR